MLPVTICLFWGFFLFLQENFEQKHDLVVEDTELRQVVYVFGCNGCTLQVKGKLNSIIVGELPEWRPKVLLEF